MIVVVVVVDNSSSTTTYGNLLHGQDRTCQEDGLEISFLSGRGGGVGVSFDVLLIILMFEV